MADPIPGTLSPDEAQDAALGHGLPPVPDAVPPGVNTEPPPPMVAPAEEEGVEDEPAR